MKGYGNFNRAVKAAIARSDKTGLPYAVYTNPIRQGYVVCRQRPGISDKPLFSTANNNEGSHKFRTSIKRKAVGVGSE